MTVALQIHCRAIRVGLVDRDVLVVVCDQRQAAVICPYGEGPVLRSTSTAACTHEGDPQDKSNGAESTLA